MDLKLSKIKLAPKSLCTFVYKQMYTVYNVGYI